MNNHYQKLYDNICRELAIFEANDDVETTNEEWLEIFYHLLVQTKNAINTEGEDA